MSLCMRRTKFLVLFNHAVNSLYNNCWNQPSQSQSREKQISRNSKRSTPFSENKNKSRDLEILFSDNLAVEIFKDKIFLHFLDSAKKTVCLINLLLFVNLDISMSCVFFLPPVMTSYLRPITIKQTNSLVCYLLLFTSKSHFSSFLFLTQVF